MNKTYTLKLKGDRAIDCVVKIANGQNTNEGNHDLADIYYHLGTDKWIEMATNRLLVLNDRDLEFAIGACDSLAFANEDNAGSDYYGREYRAIGKAFRRLQRGLEKLQTKEEAR